MRTNRWFARLPLLCLTCLALLLTACGDSGGGGDDVPTAQPDAGADGPDALSETDAAAEPDATTTSEGVLTLDDGAGYSVEVTWPPAAPELTLRVLRGETVLAESAASFLELGTVDELSDTFYYDPYDPPGSLTRWPGSLEWQPLGVTDGALTDDGIELTLAGPDVGATLTVSVDAEGTFGAQLSAVPGDRPFGYVRMNWKAPEDENYYGLGEYFDQVAHRGTYRAMQMTLDGTQESGYNEAHVPVPLLVGTRGWGLFVEERRPGAFEVAVPDNPDVVRVQFQQFEGLRFHLLAADHPLDIPGRYTRITGAPDLPPIWAFAVMQWRDEIPGQDEVLADAADMRAVDYPAGAIWVDRPFQTGHTSFEFDPNKYDDPAGMIETLHSLGYRFGIWTVPYVNQDVPDTWQECIDNDYFIEFPLGDAWPTPFDARMVDFTIPEAREMWKRNLTKMTDLGVEMFKLDYGEDIQTGFGGQRMETHFANGEDEQTMHHHYSMFYHQPYADSVDDGVLLSRTGTFGDQTLTTVVWPGDLCANFSFHGEDLNDGEPPHVGGLPAAIIAGQTLSASGYPWFASDTGGYRHDRPTSELLIRWHQYSALHPVMQMGGGRNHRPWDFSDHGDGVIYDEETLAISRDYARLHLRLFPYYFAYSRVAAEHGRPVVRPFGLAFPEDGRHPNWTFALGDWLLVAPVYRGGETTRTVPLPAGRWISWWDGQAYDGPGEVTVDAPLDVIPIFLRAGAIVPMLRPSIDTLSPATADDVDSWDNDKGHLWVRVVPAGETAFTLDGGAVLSARDDVDGVTLDVADEAVYSGYRFLVDWANRGAGSDGAPAEVTYGGAALTATDELTDGCGCWTWDADSGTVAAAVAAPFEGPLVIR